MNRKQRIETLLKTKLAEWQIKVSDVSAEHIGHKNFDGTQESHFKIVLKKNFFKKKDRLYIHKKINALLKNEFLSGLHSLEINITS